MFFVIIFEILKRGYTQHFFPIKMTTIEQVKTKNNKLVFLPPLKYKAVVKILTTGIMRPLFFPEIISLLLNTKVAVLLGKLVSTLIRIAKIRWRL